MLVTLTVANLKMIVRNRQALFWAMAFPLIFVAVFGLFDLDDLPVYEVAVVDEAGNALSRSLVNDLAALESFDVELRPEPGKALEEIRDGELGYLLTIPPDLSERIEAGGIADISLVFDESRQDSSIVLGQLQRFLDQQNLNLAGAPRSIAFVPEGVRADEADFFDFLLPGFVGMGVMTYSIIGIATVLTAYKEQRIFKRILATPLPVRSFFAGMISSNLILSLVQAAVILAAGVFILSGSIHGSVPQLFLIVLLGNLVFLSIGFIIGAYAKTVQAAGGLGNAVTLPMMFLSGTFFPTDDLPGGISTVVEFLPLSPMLVMMRGVALDADNFWEFPLEIGVLLAWIAATALIATRVFRFR